MPLFIKDETVAHLAAKAAALTGVSKTCAVRQALESHIASLEARETLSESVARIQARARTAGLRADGYDDKELMDDLSGGF